MKKRADRIVYVTGVLLACASMCASAQQKQAISISSEGTKSRYVQQLAIDVDDVPGHQIRVQESQRIYPKETGPTIEGERIVEVWTRSKTDYTQGIGPVHGYNTWITDKGNKIFLETFGTAEAQVLESGAKRGTYQGTARFTGGTGRFAKIRGNLVEVSKFYTDPKEGYNVADSHGEYWLER